MKICKVEGCEEEVVWKGGWKECPEHNKERTRARRLLNRGKPCIFEGCGIVSGNSNSYCSSAGHGHDILKHRFGAEEARRLWRKRGPEAFELFISNLDEACMYGASAIGGRFGDQAYKFIGKTNDFDRRMGEWEKNTGGLIVPIFRTEYDSSHHDLEARVISTIRSSSRFIEDMIPNTREWTYNVEVLMASYSLLEREGVDGLRWLSPYVESEGGLLRPGLWTPEREMVNA